MKKLFTMIITTGVLIFSTNSNVSAQVEQGSIIIDPYYGFPNFGKSWAQSIISDSSTNVNVIGIGPAGLRGEYLVSDNFGVGFDVIYNSVGADYNYTTWDTSGFTQTHTGTLKMQRLRVHLRLNYHFVQTEVVDAYVGFGAGTNTRKISDVSTQSNYNGQSITGAFLPVSMRVALGTRFYFTQNLGLNLELGLGGPVISGGVSLKF